MTSPLELPRPRWASGPAAVLLAVLIACAPRSAHAHRGEFLRDLALHPSDPQRLVIRYEAGLGGLLYSRDGGKTVQIVPGQSFSKYALQWHVPMLLTGDDKLLLAVDYELRIDGSGGCGLQQAEPSIAMHEISDLAPHPGDPNITYAVTTSEGTPTHRGLWKREAQGAFVPFGTPDALGVTLGEEQFRPTSLTVVARAASTGGLRFIEGGLVPDPVMPSIRRPVLRVSDDLGASWIARAIPDSSVVPGNPRILLVAAGDPLQAMVALEMGLGDIENDPNDPIYLTTDGGQSFTLYTDRIQVSGPALQLASGQILLGDRGTARTPGALWSAASFGGTLTKVHEVAATCLAYQESSNKIFMCRRHEFGHYDPASHAFCALFRMDEISSLLSCPAAPLEQNAKVATQLCGSFCDAGHFASAPLCSTFDKGSHTFCGPLAAAYDQSVGYLPPPGTLAAPRCAGSRDPDPDADVQDAGADDAGEGASAEAGEDDDPAQEPGPEDEPGEDEAESSRDDQPDGEDEPTARKKKSRGCHCTTHDPQSPRGPLSLALALSLGFYLRRRARS